MAAFPSIQLPSGISEKDISFRLKQTSEAGTTMVRGRGTATKKEFKLEWDAISSADKATLQAFFKINYGLSDITWTHFETSILYTVCFNDDDLEFDYLSPGWWKLNLTLREV